MISLINHDLIIIRFTKLKIESLILIIFALRYE